MDIEIHVNGETRRIPEGTSIHALIVELGVPTSHLAVERNREIITKAAHGATILESGDELEVVSFVGGG